MPEEVLINEGSTGERMYFLARGDCDVYIKDGDKVEKWVRSLKPGSHFGEIALL